VPLDVALLQQREFARARTSAVDDAWAACNDTFALEVEGERSSIEAAQRDLPTPAPR
jgi:hypothetical protein